MSSVPLHPMYAFDDDKSIIEDFIDNIAFNMTQDEMADAINAIAQLCAANAALKGFHEDEKIILKMCTETTQRDIVKNQFFQAEAGRIGEEVGELIAAIRKPKQDTHVPSFSNIAMELADVTIRVFDAANKRGIDIGQALIQKLVYNTTRPYKHGKNS